MVSLIEQIHELEQRSQITASVANNFIKFLLEHWDRFAPHEHLCILSPYKTRTTMYLDCEKDGIQFHLMFGRRFGFKPSIIITVQDKNHPIVDRMTSTYDIMITDDSIMGSQYPSIYTDDFLWADNLQDMTWQNIPT